MTMMSGASAKTRTSQIVYSFGRNRLLSGSGRMAIAAPDSPHSTSSSANSAFPQLPRQKKAACS